MISQPSDYQTITPVGVVDGGILPARDVAADGSNLVLGAEDLDFAIEAVNERRSIYGLSPISGNTAPVPTLALRRIDWYYIGGRLNSCISHDDGNAIYQQPAQGSDYFVDLPYSTASQPPNTLSLDWLYPAATVTERAMSTLNMDPVMDGDCVRRFFYALQFADRYNIGDIGTWSGTKTYVNRQGSYTDSINTNYWGETKALRYKAWNGTAFELAVEGLSSASLSCALPQAQLIDSAKFVFFYTLAVADDTNYGNYWFTRVFPGTVTATGVTAPQDAFMFSYDILREVTNLGYSFPQKVYSNLSWKNNNAVLKCARGFLVVNYDFRTEIRSLNWNWTP